MGTGFLCGVVECSGISGDGCTTASALITLNRALQGVICVACRIHSVKLLSDHVSQPPGEAASQVSPGPRAGPWGGKGSSGAQGGACLFSKECSVLCHHLGHLPWVTCWFFQMSLAPLLAYFSREPRGVR